MLTKAARTKGPVIKISSVAENSQVIVDHPKAIVSKTDASKTTSYKLRSAIGSLAASSAPTPLTATKAAPRFRSQAIFSVVGLASQWAWCSFSYLSGMQNWKVQTQRILLGSETLGLPWLLLTELEHC